MTLIEVGALLGGLTFIGSIITALALWKKNGADAASVLTDRALKAATNAIENLEQQAETLGKQLKETTGELQAMRRHLGVLETLLREHSIPAPSFDWPPAHRNGVA